MPLIKITFATTAEFDQVIVNPFLAQQLDFIFSFVPLLSLLCFFCFIKSLLNVKQLKALAVFFLLF